MSGSHVAGSSGRNRRAGQATRWRGAICSRMVWLAMFKLNPANDPTLLSADYALRKRGQVKDFFDPQTAEEIHRRLMEVDWWLTYNEGSEVQQWPPQDLRNLQPQQAAEIQREVYRGAQSGYQFLYNYYPLFAAYFSPKIPPMSLFPVYEFINSEPFLEFARTLTGLENIRWADGQATLYRATHFLKVHTDEVKAEQRLAAYVLNFTRDWDTDWGGLLQFWDRKGDIEQAFRPAFNALNIFTVPQPHSVSAVTPYAPGLRLSITGWLRADEPPKAFPAR
ncbi:2OG-Fe(II) oxygenase family protein [Altererythrobacter arenosus]|uniref:2OG-Fe(II) oxygenase family protein n=1 Tax=Altererythrobacter arenosus TaxID=3032592 RepID=A0ABY8FMS0_9SPHN|nr:2OG-Fe(II) oxygenase family protein [Altererythrobacter sp. CAU 1644]WFL76072.1 2OG-Fe(II) oxygenase family protein [Altererythrobacter sp. CAU 1644]